MAKETMRVQAAYSEIRTILNDLDHWNMPGLSFFQNELKELELAEKREDLEWQFKLHPWSEPKPMRVDWRECLYSAISRLMIYHEGRCYTLYQNPRLGRAVRIGMALCKKYKATRPDYFADSWPHPC